MKKLFILLFVTIGVNAQKYVTTAGSGTTCSEGSPCGLTYAFANAVAGDTVNIKAGNYGTGTHSISNSGTSGNPIKFIGYTTTPGDIVASNGSTFSYGDAVNSAVMPLLQGVMVGDIGSGTGIYAGKNYVELHNFQVKNYKTGVSFEGTNNVLNNVISIDHGDFNSATYNGRCFNVNGNNSTITNCFALNGGAEGFFFRGDYSIHSYNKVYSDNTVNPTDYYYLLGDESVSASFNEVSNIHIERVGDLSHGGHGLIPKRSADNNNFYDCTIVNTSIEVSRHEANNNSFYRCDVIGNAAYPEGGILIRDGAYGNYFEDCTTSNNRGVYFLMAAAGSMDLDNPADYNAGQDNIFNRLTVYDCAIGINFFPYFSDPSGYNGYSADNNLFYNCTFNNLDYLFAESRANSGTILTNCTISDVTNFKTKEGSGTTYGIDDTYTTVNFYTLGFTTPTGTDITTGNPLYVNAATGDFTLQGGSPLLDQGIVTPYLAVGNDIGAIQSGSPPQASTIIRAHKIRLGTGGGGAYLGTNKIN